MWDSSWLFKLLSVVSAFLIGTWVSLPAAVQVLCFLMACDYLTGMIAAYHTKQMDSEIGLKGALTKVAILILLFALHHAASVAHLSEEVNDWMTAGVTLFFVINEMISVTENCVRANVKVPPKLIQALKKAKRLGGWDGREKRVAAVPVTAERRKR